MNKVQEIETFLKNIIKYKDFFNIDDLSAIESINDNTI